MQSLTHTHAHTQTLTHTHLHTLPTLTIHLSTLFYSFYQEYCSYTFPALPSFLLCHAQSGKTGQPCPSPQRSNSSSLLYFKVDLSSQLTFFFLPIGNLYRNRRAGIYFHSFGEFCLCLRLRCVTLENVSLWLPESDNPGVSCFWGPKLLRPWAPMVLCSPIQYSVNKH